MDGQENQPSEDMDSATRDGDDMAATNSQSLLQEVAADQLKRKQETTDVEKPKKSRLEIDANEEHMKVPGEKEQDKIEIKSTNELSTNTEVENQGCEMGDDEIKDESLPASEKGDAKASVIENNEPDEENDCGDAPMDLSKGISNCTTEEKKVSNGEDVIMLSDEEDDLTKFVNGFRNVSPEELQQTRKAIRKLQEDLRNEETKLVLLKKIRQSQLVAASLDGGSVPSKTAQAPGKIVNRTVPQQNHQVNRSNQPPAHAHANKPQTIQQQLQQRSQLSQNNQVSATRVTNKSAAVTPSHTATSQPSQPARSSGAIQQPAYHGSQQSASSKLSQPEQSPSQRQAAAKLALRKQLEKTLLQIPPPKPPPPEMNFIPSTASGDFIPLVGLEEVVKFIVEADARNKGGKVPEVKYVFNPFTCVQCGTDFTPVWKRDKPGSKNVICEQCVTSNQKKALKQEHTNRLKSAFVKALQQEQEIEQRMQQSEKNAPSSATSSASAHASHAKVGSQTHQRSTPVSAHSHGSANTVTSSRSSGSSHSGSSGSSGSSNSNYKAEQLRQHQNLLQLHQQQLRSLGLVNLPNFAPHLPFPYQPQMTAKQAADLQRQYLLDMIQPRSLPGSSNIWRNK